MKRIAILAFILAFTGAVAPGPMLALVIAQTLAQGLWAVVPILVGHALVEAVFILLLSLGLGRVLRGEMTRGALSIAGGLMLGWMGAIMLASVGQTSLAAESAIKPLGWFVLVSAGAGVSLSNPYFTGWWGTVGSGQVAALNLATKKQYLIFLAGHELGDAVWYCLVAATFIFGRAWLSDDFYHALLVVCALVICLLAVIFTVMGAGWLVKGLRHRRMQTPQVCGRCVGSMSRKARH